MSADGRCRRCDGFGRYTDYFGGRVLPVYCTCPAGDAFRKRAGVDEVWPPIEMATRYKAGKEDE